MKKFYEDLIECAVASIIIAAIIVSSVLQFQNNEILKNKIDNLESQMKSSENLNSYSLKGISEEIKENYSKLIKQIEQVPVLEKITKLELEARLQQINVMVFNESIGATGSGVTIKWKNNFYVLSAGHMASKPEDKLSLNENGVMICELEIVKIAYDEELTENGNDLILLRPKNINIVPKIYVEIADIEPETSNELYIVGNPMGVEDVVSDARAIMYRGNFMYMIATSSYFGNSGGGIYTREGKLVGIMSHLVPIQPFADAPVWTIHGCVRLNVILEFLRGVS